MGLIAKAQGFDLVLEHVWGGGEQMSYFDLRGRRFPLWTSESGVGRDRSSPITFQADREGRAGGDYWTTNDPQPSGLGAPRTVRADRQTLSRPNSSADRKWRTSRQALPPDNGRTT